VMTSSSPQEQTLNDIRKFLDTLEAPAFNSVQARKRFVKRATKFFVRNDQMFKRLSGRPPVLVVFDSTKRAAILERAHE
ncbi:hypothetical protein BV22DRAFT_994742, partial [Leucogyrophana mollusca]